jgi:hypothetical protein
MRPGGGRYPGFGRLRTRGRRSRGRTRLRRRRRGATSTGRCRREARRRRIRRMWVSGQPWLHADAMSTGGVHLPGIVGRKANLGIGRELACGPPRRAATQRLRRMLPPRTARYPLRGPFASPRLRATRVPRLQQCHRGVKPSASLVHCERPTERMRRASGKGATTPQAHPNPRVCPKRRQLTPLRALVAFARRVHRNARSDGAGSRDRNRPARASRCLGY